MILHIGRDTFIPTEQLVAILSCEEEPPQLPGTSDYVSRIGSEPTKSVLIVEHKGQRGVYLSPISSVTLSKRAALKKEQTQETEVFEK